MHDKVVLIHIPKTAGSSLRAVLAYAMGNVHGNAHQLIGIDSPEDGMPYFEGLASKSARALPGLFHDGLQVMSGHYRYRDIAPVLGEMRNQVTLVSFLREPIRRTLSDYFYSTSERHTGHDAIQKAYPTFEDYTRNTGEMNKQFDYLRPFDGAPLDITIENALHNLDFLGLTENFESDVSQFLDALQAKSDQQFAENINPNREELENAYDTYHEMLQEILAPDIALYQAVVEQRRFPR